jgi:two-component system phosphate regulon response regulator PhoB
MESDESAQPARPPVLIVDDEPDLRETLRMVLDEEGYPVATAATGSDALAILRASHTPYVVLLDHYLSDGSGRVVLSALRSDPATARHAVIYMSAGGEREVTALRAEFAQLQVPYLRKPFDLDDVLTLVAEAATRLASAASRHGPCGARGPYSIVA